MLSWTTQVLIIGATQNKRTVLILSLSGVPGTGASAPHVSALKEACGRHYLKKKEGKRLNSDDVGPTVFKVRV